MERTVLHFLDTHEWDIPDWEGLQARYEHCSFVSESDPESLWVFGGAEQSATRNSVQVLHTTGDYCTVLGVDFTVGFSFYDTARVLCSRVQNVLSGEQWRGKARARPRGRTTRTRRVLETDCSSSLGERRGPRPWPTPRCTSLTQVSSLRKTTVYACTLKHYALEKLVKDWNWVLGMPFVIFFSHAACICSI